ncbi:uncharacterized protein APUU_10532A [Aspergillus puulaauensis]|uniref:Short-chain dehydrogenase n=1 Tax=Aspergillus puulaauensis TaxID=1220207 RepID=A0A7R7XAF9_9EURO|nr:uncharacterized protein APUU_10532A [Aspergillus puulaauensis]BCS17704.1 hypothetical protein APUU_10532A [Aspergillus puulaauensis]
MGAIYSRFFTKLTLPPFSSLNGKTILITGGNTGLGREAARHALTLGANVILGVRSVSKGDEAKKDITSGIVAGDARVHVWPIDLESFASVKAFAGRAREYVASGGRLDFAIMNAGLASVEWATTGDGWERGLQVNDLSTALLSLELLPLLLQAKEQDPASQPHLTLLASDIHKNARFPERDTDSILKSLNSQEEWKTSQTLGGPTERYAITKLLDIYITKELARLAPRDENGDPLVIVNCVAPGFCKSNLLSREENIPLMIKIVQAIVARTIEEGSKTLVHAVTQGPETHGQWLEDQVIRDPGNLVSDPDLVVAREKLWKEIVAVLKEVDPEIRTEY